MHCKICHGPCLSPATIAGRLRQLLLDTRAWAVEFEAEPGGAVTAERELLGIEHERLASELDGICSECWMAHTSRSDRVN